MSHDQPDLARWDAMSFVERMELMAWIDSTLLGWRRGAPLPDCFEGTREEAISSLESERDAYKARGKEITAHNHRVCQEWSKLACPGCGGGLMYGWGLLPETPLDPAKPPELCYRCAPLTGPVIS